MSCMCVTRTFQSLTNLSFLFIEFLFFSFQALSIQVFLSKASIAPKHAHGAHYRRRIRLFYWNLFYYCVCLRTCIIVLVFSKNTGECVKGYLYMQRVSGGTGSFKRTPFV